MISIKSSLIWWFISTVLCYSLVAIYAISGEGPREFGKDLTTVILASWAVMNSGWFFLIVGIAAGKFIRKVSETIADTFSR